MGATSCGLVPHVMVGAMSLARMSTSLSYTAPASLASERQWFAEHRLYSKMPPGKTGVPCLIDKLGKILFRSIKSFLPEIKREIGNRLRDVTKRLSELGEGVPRGSGGSLWLFCFLSIFFPRVGLDGMRVGEI